MLDQKKPGWKILKVAFIIGMITALINVIRDNSSGIVYSITNGLINCLYYSFYIGGIIFMVMYISANKKITRIYKELNKDNKNDEIIEVFKLKADKSIVKGSVLANYILLSTYFRMENYDEGFKLLHNTYWRNYYNNVRYFEALHLLYIDDISSSKIIAEGIRKSKKLSIQYSTLQAIYTYIDTGEYNDILDNSQYPIVKEICNKYKK